jgi:hypothetical protein
MDNTEYVFTDADNAEFDELVRTGGTGGNSVQTALEQGGLIGASQVYSETTGGSTSQQRIEVKCEKCRGTGQFIGYTGRLLGECFTCHGSGKILRNVNYEANKAKREVAKVAKQARVVAEKAAQLAEWKAANPDVWAALQEYAQQTSYQSDFMTSMISNLGTYGSLTDGQSAAIRRGIEKRAAARAAKGQAPVASFPRIEKLVRVDNMQLHLGNSKVVLFQSGALAVVAPVFGQGTFGIIEHGGALRRFSKMSDEVFTTLQDVEARGLEAVKEIGRATGHCCICGRTLTDAHSIEAGIGPICEGRWNR